MKTLLKLSLLPVAGFLGYLTYCGVVGAIYALKHDEMPTAEEAIELASFKRLP